jgi:hypothetical protein
MQRNILIAGALLTAISAGGVSAQSPNPPANDINCNDFTKQGPDTWLANGTVHLRIDGIDITYNNSTVKPGMKTTAGVDVYALLDSMCGGH